jgi:radical SAM superfamily enzyme YgiQ (UPF0313 family)
MKVLLVHPPFYDRKGLITGGLFAIAEYLNRHGHPAKIIHLGVECELDSSFAIRDYVVEGEFDLVGISVHWCEQIPEAVSIAQKLKGAGCFVLFGGNAASHFAWEMLSRFDFVDFIVKGDGEEPLLELCNLLDGHSRDFSKVSNLLYKVQGKPAESERIYVADENRLNELVFSDVGLLRHYQHYRDNISLSPCISLQNTSPLKGPCFYLLLGRGCNFNCTFCGGNKITQERLYHRSMAVTLSPEKVMQTMVSAFERGFRHFFIGFDPRQDNSYYQQIFSLIRRSGLRVGMIFESSGLPERSFLEDLAATFVCGIVIISPESASEKVRKANKALFFTNNELEKTLSVIGRLGLFCHLYYGYFLPRDREEDIRQTIQTIGRLSIRYGHFLKPVYNRFVNDPCALYRLDPDSYGMTRPDDSLEYYLSLKPGISSKIPHPVDMSDEDALRLSRLITVFIRIIKGFPNLYKYLNKKAVSPESFLILLEEWLSENSTWEFDNFFQWIFEQVDIDKDRCRLVLALDKARTCHSCESL